MRNRGHTVIVMFALAPLLGSCYAPQTIRPADSTKKLHIQRKAMALTVEKISEGFEAYDGNVKRHFKAATKKWPALKQLFFPSEGLTESSGVKESTKSSHAVAKAGLSSKWAIEQMANTISLSKLKKKMEFLQGAVSDLSECQQGKMSLEELRKNLDDRVKNIERDAKVLAEEYVDRGVRLLKLEKP